METLRATLACDTQLPRSELLKKFRWLQQHFPDSEHSPSVADKVAILESMVAERSAIEKPATLAGLVRWLPKQRELLASSDMN